MSHVEPLRVGDVEIAVMCQGWAPLLLADESPRHDVDWARERRTFPWAFDGEAHWQWHVQAFVVRTPDGITMVDTGLGGNRSVAPWAPGEGLTGEQAYADSGVDPSEVATVVLTHMHPDHSGGIRRRDGEPRFANARHVLHPADWAFLADEQRSEFSRLARPGLQRVHELGMLDLDEGDRDVAPGIEVRHTPGHTPGHRSVLVHVGDDVILLTGDLLLLPNQFANPTWVSSHDEEPETAARSRTAMVSAAVDGGWAVGVPHFAEPFGTVTGAGWSSRWNG
jgi:glyoxylase-like metal-dependent hydrolase (beta-lactamase superfamily II)